MIAELREVNARLVAANAALATRVGELERRLGKDSSSSSRTPSSDGLAGRLWAGGGGVVVAALVSRSSGSNRSAW